MEGRRTHVAWVWLAALLLATGSGQAAESPAMIRVHLQESRGDIDPMIFGHFTELTLTAYEGGVSSELLFNRKFGWEDPPERLVHLRTGTAAGWEPLRFAPAVALSLDPKVWYSPPYGQRITLTAPGEGPAGVAQRGFQTVVKHLSPTQRADYPFRFAAGVAYRARLAVRFADYPGTVQVALGRSPDDAVAREVLRAEGPDWTVYEFLLTPERDVEDALFMVYIDEPGTVWVDSASLCEEGRNVAGFRRDAVDLTRTLTPTNLRFPGGSFADDYDWKDGVGTLDRRPDRLNRAWQSWLTNDVGTDEFVNLCRMLDAEPYICVNFGTGTPEEAAEWVEYCNGSAETRWGAVRAGNGAPDPYGVKYWGVGNEICLPSEIGTTNGHDYGRRFRDFARAMRRVDPGIRLVAVGWFPLEPSQRAAMEQDESLRQLFRYIDGWTEAVLSEAGEDIDLLSLHAYEPHRIEEQATLDEVNALGLAIARDLERRLDRFQEVVGKYAPPGKHIPVAFDEWAVWMSGPAADPHPAPIDRLQAGFRGPREVWRQAVAEAAVFNLMQRRPRDFALANKTMLFGFGVGEIGIVRDAVAASACARMMGLFATRETCRALRVEVDSPMFRVRPIRPEFEESFRDPVPYLDASARTRPDGRTVELFVVNRNLRESISCPIRFEGGLVRPQVDVAFLHSEDLYVGNTFDTPDAISVRTQTLSGTDTEVRHEFPPQSVTRMTFQVK